MKDFLKDGQYVMKLQSYEVVGLLVMDYLPYPVYCMFLRVLYVGRWGW